MKVKELLTALSNLDQNLDVICYTEDENFQENGHMIRLLEIETVSVSHAEMRRGDDGTPTLKLGKSELSKPIAFVQVFSDF